MEDINEKAFSKTFHGFGEDTSSGNEVKNTNEAGYQRHYDLSKWSHAQDPESGHYYYYHLETGETQWKSRLVIHHILRKRSI